MLPSSPCLFYFLIWNISQTYSLFFTRNNGNLLCIIPILVYWNIKLFFNYIWKNKQKIKWLPYTWLTWIWFSEHWVPPGKISEPRLTSKPWILSGLAKSKQKKNQMLLIYNAIEFGKFISTILSILKYVLRWT